MRVNGPIGAVIAAAAQHGLVDVVSREPNLEDVFLAQYGGHPTPRRPSDERGGTMAVDPCPPVVAGHGPRDDLRQDPARQPPRGAGRRLVGGLFMLLTAAPYGTEFTTRRRAALFVSQMTSLPPVFQGLLGEPIHIETLGGFLSWRVGNFLPILLGLWSVIALSGTLAGEAASGSLDLVAVDAAQPAVHRACRRSPPMSRPCRSRC